MYSIDAVKLARYVIWYANQKRIPITPLKLQKILYYLQGASLRCFGRTLFDDRIEAWQYGPVVRNVYFAFCGNGVMPLYAKMEDGKLCDGLSKDVKDMIDKELDELLKQSARQLVQRSHEDDPWKALKSRVEKGEKPIITVDSMRDFFIGGTAR